MQSNLQEIYATTIEPLSKEEQLRLAILVLEKVAGRTLSNGESLEPKRQGDITKFFGFWKGGSADDSDNEKIDADLARAYAKDFGSVD